LLEALGVFAFMAAFVAAFTFFITRERIIYTNGSTLVVTSDERIVVTFTHWAGVIEAEAFFTKHGSFPAEVFVGGKPGSIFLSSAVRSAYKYHQGTKGPLD
jgi:hypothetical protein